MNKIISKKNIISNKNGVMFYLDENNIKRYKFMSGKPICGRDKNNKIQKW